jgi:CubicO group peptidase (beta-lactamase class C family)
LTIVLPGSHDDDYIKSYPGASIEQKVACGIKNKDIRIAFPPVGSKFNYSDVNYLVLSLIVEKASDMPYEDFLEANIFDPLGMEDSGTGYDPAANPMLAKGYGPDGAMLAPGLTCADMCGGAGSIYSTVGDMYKWDRALNAGELISENSLKAMFTPYNDTYGYGWWFSDTGSGVIPEHGGRLLNGTFSGFFVRDTINDSTAIVLGNDGNHDDKRGFAEEVCSMLAQ